MALKRRFNDSEKYGLSEEEIKIGEKYLRKNKTAGALKELEAAKLFEHYLLGDSLTRIQQLFPQYPMGQIVLTAALRRWPYDRDKMMHTLQDRVKAKVVKSVLEQVDFYSTIMTVANTEHLDKMIKYIQDPINNPKPDLRIESIKDYKDISEALYKLVAGATGGGDKGKGKSPLFEALTAPPPPAPIENKPSEKEDDISILDVE